MSYVYWAITGQYSIINDPITGFVNTSRFTTPNMSVHLHGNEDEFASQLLTIEDSKYSIDTSPEIIQLSEHVGTLHAAIDF